MTDRQTPPPQPANQFLDRIDRLINWALVITLFLAAVLVIPTNVPMGLVLLVLLGILYPDNKLPLSLKLAATVLGLILIEVVL
jgi:hypothetical protein